MSQETSDSDLQTTTFLGSCEGADLFPSLQNLELQDVDEELETPSNQIKEEAWSPVDSPASQQEEPASPRRHTEQTEPPKRHTSRHRKAPKKYSQFSRHDVPESTPGPSKKRTKMSLEGLTDAEKYLRIRAQNNVASKKCREKKKQSNHQLKLECMEQEKMNKILKQENEVLKRRRDKIKALFIEFNKRD